MRSERTAGEPGRYREDQEHGEEVGQGVRVLEGVGRVGIEEATAVRAQLLDDLLRGHRPHGDHLLAPVQGRHLLVGGEVLDHSLGHEEEREHEAQR